MKSDWTLIFLGVVSAVLAAIVVEWINRSFNSPTGTANDAAWNRALFTDALPNYNRNPESPAYTYQGGAPVTNFRSFQRVGVLEVPTA